MRVWIFNHYAGGMYKEKGGRHYWIAKYLKRDGYDPVVFCCNELHNSNGSVFETDKFCHMHLAKEIDVPFVFVNARTYQGNGRDRVMNMVDFYVNVQRAAKIYARKHGRPDIIYASSVHPLTLVAGIQLAKHFRVKCICEVRDLWPETLVAYGKLQADHTVTKALYKGEKWIYTKADALIFTMEGGKDYILDQGWGKEVSPDKIYHINNGVDLEEFDANAEKFRLTDTDLTDKKTFKLIYTGSVREVNRPDLLIELADQLKEEKDIRILVYGDGTKLEECREEVQSRGLQNIIFKGFVEKRYIPYIVKQADVCLMHGDTVELFKYGISLNKSFEYLASGKPIISSYPSPYEYIESNGCGYNVDSKDMDRYAEIVLRIKEMPKEAYEGMCSRALQTARAFDFKEHTKTLERIIEQYT